MSARALAIRFIVLLWAVPAFAYRPFDGTDADVADTGKFELDLAPVGFYRLGTRNQLTLANAVFNYGVLPRVELVGQFEYVLPLGRSPIPPDQGLDSGVFAKIVAREGCLQGRSGVSLGIEAGLLFPAIGADGNVGASATFILSQCLGTAAVLHYNAQVELTPDHNLNVFASVIGEGPRAWLVRPVAEVYVEREFHVYLAYSALVGLIWSAAPTLDVDAGFRVGSLGGLFVTEARLGTTWTFP